LKALERVATKRQKNCKHPIKSDTSGLLRDGEGGMYTIFQTRCVICEYLIKETRRPYGEKDE
jgi:hypothetical protein